MKKFIEDYDIVKKYSTFVNRILNDHTYSKISDPYLKGKYHAYVKKQQVQTKHDHTFYERQEIDVLIKDSNNQQQEPQKSVRSSTDKRDLMIETN